MEAAHQALGEVAHRTRKEVN